MAGTRRKFTPEFRAEAVRSVTGTGRPIAHVAAEIGVGAQLLGRWVEAAKTTPQAADRVLDVDERAELERLRAENAELRLDRSFLKKAAADSMGQRNGVVKFSGRGDVVVHLSGSVVQLGRDLVQVFLAVSGEVASVGEVLTQ